MCVALFGLIMATTSVAVSEESTTQSGDFSADEYIKDHGLLLENNQDWKLAGWDIGVIIAYFILVIGVGILVNLSLYELFNTTLLTITYLSVHSSGIGT